MVCCLPGQAEFFGERVHSLAVPVLEKGADYSGCLAATASGEVLRDNPGGEGDLQAPPDVGGVGSLDPDARREGLEDQGADLIGEWQGSVQRRG